MSSLRLGLVDTGVNPTEFCREQARLFLLNLPSPRFTVPGVAVFPIWESLAMLPVEVFTVFTLFTLLLIVHKSCLSVKTYSLRC